jgi:hypothetical protein
MVVPDFTVSVACVKGSGQRHTPPQCLVGYFVEGAESEADSF